MGGPNEPPQLEASQQPATLLDKLRAGTAADAATAGTSNKLTFLFLGAGTVTQWAADFVKNLKKIYE